MDIFHDSKLGCNTTFYRNEKTNISLYLFICLYVYLFIYLNKIHLNTFKHWLCHRTRGLKTDSTRLFSEFSEYLFSQFMLYFGTCFNSFGPIICF